MIRLDISLFAFLISVNILAADVPAGTCCDQGAIIKLNVGGAIFQTKRETLCKYPNSPLAAMFTTTGILKPWTLTDDGCVFIDEDPTAFNNILNFLRNGTINLSNQNNARQTRALAKNLLPEMVQAIDDWNGETPIRLTISRRCYGEKKFLWYVCDATSGKIIGNERMGCKDYRTTELSYLKEYENRTVHKDLCYSWSGNGNQIYNCKNGKQIGEVPDDDYRSHEILGKGDNKYFSLKLIENAVRVSPGRYYVCNFNRLGTFSIFDANTGTKMLPDLSFTSLEECTAVLMAKIKAHKL
jgi:hypothetical protein